MVLSFFMNAAIDQQCELYIRESGLEAEVEERSRPSTEKRAYPDRATRESCPTGSDGLGLMLLGVSGDEVLPLETYERVKQETLSKVRGTVQADILKEDQAQNTCIFSSEFALRMMGDIQQYFIDRRCATSIRSPSPATTSPKPGRIPSPSWLSLWPTASRWWSTTCRGG